MKSQPSVIVYTTPTCPHCNMVKEFLRRHKVSFVEKDVSKDEDAAIEMIRKSGSMSVPVIDINGEIIVGFKEDAIRKALKLP